MFAYISPTVSELQYPKTAYQYINNGEETFRVIPKEHTPATIEEADMIIIAELSYTYWGEYTDGTVAYKCNADFYAYDLLTGQCLTYIGSAYMDPPLSILADSTKGEEYPLPDTTEVSSLINDWLDKSDSQND